MRKLIFPLLLLAIACIGWGPMMMSGGGTAAWHTDWGRKVVIEIQNTLCTSGPLAYFPILLTPDTIDPEAIDTDDGDYATNKAQSDCADFRVYAGDYSASNPATENTNRLPIEIVSCTHGSSPTLQVWVAVDSVSCTSTHTDITLYYNATGKTQPADDDAQYGQDDVWDDGAWGSGNNYFKGVYHFEQTDPSSQNLVDSTQYDNDGTPSNMASTADKAAKIGLGWDFDGSDDIVNLGSDSSLDNIFTSGGAVSAWIAQDSDGGGNYGKVAGKDGDTGWAVQTRDEVGGSVALGFWHTHSVNIGNWDSGAVWANGTLEYMAWTYDKGSNGNNPTLYENSTTHTEGSGLTKTQTPDGTATDENTLSAYIGNRPSDSARGFDGDIDEFRIHSDARSASWWEAEYNTSNAPSTYAVEGSPTSP